MKDLALVALGGALGSISRYALARYIAESLNRIFPYGTFAVNALGSLGIGVFFACFHEFALPPTLRIFLTIGFLGGFTTFSTYAYESENLLRNHDLRIGLGYILASNIVSIALVAVGLFGTRALIRMIR